MYCNIFACDWCVRMKSLKRKKSVEKCFYTNQDDEIVTVTIYLIL